MNTIKSWENILKLDGYEDDLEYYERQVTGYFYKTEFFKKDLKKN